jgi:hypothetical protein
VILGPVSVGWRDQGPHTTAVPLTETISMPLF